MLGVAGLGVLVVELILNGGITQIDVLHKADVIVQIAVGNGGAVMGGEKGVPFALQALQTQHIFMMGAELGVQHEVVAGDGLRLVHQHLCALQLISYEEIAVLAIEEGQRAVGVGGDVKELNDATTQVLANGLGLLGVSAPEKM